MTRWATQKAALVRRRSELTARLTRIESELDRPATPDDDDRATEIELDEVLEDVALAGQKELVAIEAALRRMEEGGFGTCRRCGEPISKARLRAVPTTTVCRLCAQATP